jgi:hypothetical protein
MTQFNLFADDANTDPAIVLQKRLDSLTAIGESDRTHTRIQQCLGVVSAFGFGVVASAGATVAAPLAAAGLACAAGLYALPTFKEAARTGGFRPLPFVDADLVKLLTMADSKQSGYDHGDIPALEGYHYLSARDKAEYTLIGTFGQMIAAVMREIPPDRRASEWHRLVSLFVSRYGKVIRESPHALLGEVDPAKLAGFLTETPEVAKARIASLRSALDDDDDWDDDDDGKVMPDYIFDDAPSPQTPQIQQRPQPGTPGFIAQMAHHIKNTMIIGVPGVGKGLTVSNLVKEARKRHPGKHIVGIDPKNSEKESGSWANGYDKVFRFSLSALGSEAGLREFNKALRYFKDFPGEKLLIMDEGLSVMRCLKRDAEQLREFNDWLTFLTSMGDSEGIHLWFISQTGNLKDLGIDSSVRACFDLLAMMTLGNEALMQGLLRTDLMPSGKASNPKVVKAAIADSEIGRAYYFNRIGEWLPMPTLPNHSGYDRDKRQWINGAAPTIEPSPVAGELPDLYQAIANLTIAQTFEQPGTINADGQKEPLPTDYDRVIQWVVGKLERKPEGWRKSDLWAQAPNSIKANLTRADFDSYLDDGVIDSHFQRDENRLFITSN